MNSDSEYAIVLDDSDRKHRPQHHSHHRRTRAQHSIRDSQMPPAAGTEASTLRQHTGNGVRQAGKRGYEPLSGGIEREEGVVGEESAILVLTHEAVAVLRDPGVPLCVPFRVKP